MKNFNKIKNEQIDKLNTFVEVNSPAWRIPNQISIDELLKGVKTEKIEKVETIEYKTEKYDIINDIDNNTLIIDEKTLKVKVNSSFLKTPSVFSEPYSNQNISFNIPPENASVVSGMHLVTDGNYLYIWTGKRWKRTLLSTW